jgi:hypothetical protein
MNHLDKDCFSQIIYHTQNDQDTISFAMTSRLMLTRFRDHYQKLPVTECLVSHQFCSFVPLAFMPDFSLIHNIIECEKKISFRWILVNYKIPIEIFNKMINLMVLYAHDDLVLILMKFFADNALPFHLNIDCFLKLIRRAFHLDHPMSKFIFENPVHNNI